MNLTQALEICPDFTVSRDDQGKIVCRHIRGGEVCALPTRFVCELVTFKQRTAKKSLPMISHSRMQALEKCPRHYFLKYESRVRYPVEPDYFGLGKMFGTARSRIDAGLPWELPSGLPAESLAKLEVLLEFYEKSQRPQIGQAEKRVEFEWKGYIVQGYADCIAPDGKRMYEWKYAQSPDKYTPLTLARQIATYLKGLPEIDEVVIAVAKKPRHQMRVQPTKTLPAENLDDFKARLRSELEGKDLFVYKTCTRSMFNVDAELDSLVELAETAKRYKSSGIYPPNYWSCDDCSYEPFCVSHVGVQALGSHTDGETCSHPSICAAIKGRDALPPKPLVQQTPALPAGEPDEEPTA